MNKELLERLKKASTIKESAVLSESKFFENGELCQTDVPALNVALGGALDGGVTSGLIIWAGPSKHFKTSYQLLLLKSYLDKYPESVGIWYDSEFGSPQSYFESFGIDTKRILHVPITNIEEFKFDVMQQLNGLKRGDKVFFAIDSIGNLASKKEVDDALNEKAVADMTRAKQLKGLFRMITPILTVKDLIMSAVNHTYQTQEMYSKSVVSGGTGIYYSANTIFIIGRQQEKGDDGIIGYNFVLNVEKSRTVREKSKIIINVTYEDGINRWSGLLDMGLESGHVIKPNQGWYSRVNKETGEIEPKKWRAKDTNTGEFWKPVLASETFKTWVKERYQLSGGQMLTDENIDAAMEMDSGDDSGGISIELEND